VLSPALLVDLILLLELNMVFYEI